MEHRTSTAAFRRTRFCAVRFNSFHDISMSSYSFCIVLLHEFLGPPFLLALEGSLKGLASDVGDKFPQGVANPPPFSSPNVDFNPLLIGTLPQVLIRGPPWPPDSQDVLEPAIDEGLKSVSKSQIIKGGLTAEYILKWGSGGGGGGGAKANASA